MRLAVCIPRRSRPAMFPRWLIRKTMTPEMRGARPYLRRYGVRSHMLWVSMLRKQRRA